MSQCRKCERGASWDFLTSIVVQNIKTNEGETLWCNPKNFKKNRIVSKKIRVENTKRVLRSLVCFRGSGRRCFCFGRGSGVLSMFLTSFDVVEQMNKKVDSTRLKKITHCKSRAHFLLKCSD